MSNLYKRRLSLSGIDVTSMTTEELRMLVLKVLETKIHGLSFSPYTEGQGPGTAIGEDQIRERLAVIEASVRWIRTFSCTDGHERKAQETIAITGAQKATKLQVTLR